MSDLGNKKIFAENLKRLMEQRGKDRQAVCNDLNFRYSTFSEWINAVKYPRIDKIEMLANYFGVQKSDLIEKYNPGDEKPPVLTPGTAKIYYTDRGDGRTKVKEVPSEAIDKALDLLRTLAPEIFDDDK